MTRLAVALSASNVRSARCAFSHPDTLCWLRGLLTTLKCSGASTVAFSRASNVGTAVPATTAPSMTCTKSDPTWCTGSGDGRGVERGEVGSHLPCADGPLCPRGAKLTESEGAVVQCRHARPLAVSEVSGGISVLSLVGTSICT